MEFVDFTPEQEKDLRALGRDAAGVSRSLWEPGCVSRMFRTETSKVSFTMQVWIDLDDARSPLLETGRLEKLEDFEKAFAAFGLVVTAPLDPADQAAFTVRMQSEVRDGFAMMVKMRPPRGMECVADVDGFGQWLPMMAALTKACGGYKAALAMKVGRAFALLAGMKRNEGWAVVEDTYAFRDIDENAEDETGEKQ